MTWLEVEENKTYDNGASLLIRGYKCPACNFLRHRRKGKSNFCEVCGVDLREERKVPA